jgi:gliding motility-associated protein GldM
MAVNDPNSPRQRMINLMYLVFIAMLALNVSSDVLQGFELVEDSLRRSVKVSTQHNEQIFSELQNYFETNEDKAREWFEKGEQVKAQTDSLYNFIQDLKWRIVRKADGKNADINNLSRTDDLNASQDVMFERGKNEGTRLRNKIDDYREFVLSLVTDPSIRNIINSNLSTEPSARAIENKQSWEESLFWHMPMAAAITLLTKMQSDIRFAEGQVLADLLRNIDVDDIRVNSLQAFVIPLSQTVMAGGAFQGNIVLAAVDTTQQPRIYIGDRLLPEENRGAFSIPAGSIGTHRLSGHIEVPRRDGTPTKEPFSSEFFVVQPTATIAPVLMNVLYAGIPNEISIAAAGAATQNVTATSTNGTLTRKANDIWTVTPQLGSDAVITVSATMPGGRTQNMGSQTFRVRRLPDPIAFLNVTNPDGNQSRFRGGPLAKPGLMAIESLNAAIDDGILDIPFTVLRFDVTTTDGMGIMQRETSDGARFSARQKELIRSANRGKQVLITRIVTRGPDGAERTLQNPIEIIIN